jgi:predicted amidohydrolase YtcJ
MSVSRIPKVQLFDGQSFLGERSILFDENEILAVEAPTRVKNPDERIYEMPGGALALPGFFDSHTHFAQHGLAEILGTYLREVRDLDHLLQLIRDIVRTSEEDVIILDGLDESEWADRRLPTRTELDRACRTTPLFVRRICGHITVCNTRAIDRLPDSIVLENPDLGILNTSNISLGDLFPTRPERIRQGIRHAQSLAHSLGITSIYDYGKLRHFKAYRELEEKGELNIRVHFAFYPDQADIALEQEDVRETCSPFLQVRGFKLYLDGSVGARTAAFFEPYADAPETTGFLYRTQEEIEARLAQADTVGLQVSLHAIGDRAIEQALRALQGSSRRAELRHRLEHLEFPTEEEILKARGLDLLLSVQPNFIANWAGRDGLYWSRLGEDRWRWNNPLGTLSRAGLRMAFGSDSMPMGPMVGIRGALEHPVPSERLELDHALESYTSQGAFYAGRENELGRLKNGYLPDITVLSGIPAPGRTEEIRPLAVFVDGRPVFLDTYTLL